MAGYSVIDIENLSCKQLLFFLGGSFFHSELDVSDLESRKTCFVLLGKTSISIDFWCKGTQPL